MNTPRRPFSSALSLTLNGFAAGLMMMCAGAAQAEVVSAAAAQQHLQEGAQAFDVRAGNTAALLPGALRLDAAACLEWLRAGDVQALSRAVSAAGLDLSRDVLIYGEAGDPRAQALYEALRPVSTGRLLWLVGGIAEWQQSGRATVPAASTRWPVPQHLVRVASQLESGTARMAAASLRTPVEAPEQIAAAR